VLQRLFAGPEVGDGGEGARLADREVQALADRLVPPGGGYEWNQALMEFGALHCTARRPACVACPLQAHCRAYPAIQTALAEGRARERRRGEGPFEGSARYYRGRLVAALRALPAGEALEIARLGPQVRPDFSEEHLPWLYDLVRGLERDGLAVAEDGAGYGAADPSQVRVRLP
ncbi:MAG: A/G-specific adenine glycosylase, partial [Thermomicrobiaceae bacterium]|nr:A/G-specific adenine glycosylase [Thermomicrobiaceae bacterium]